MRLFRRTAYGRLRMSEMLNVYWHEDGHYVISPGPLVDTLRSDHLAWLGTMRRDSIDPDLRRGIEEQLQLHACAMVTAAQFYAPSTARLHATPH